MCTYEKLSEMNTRPDAASVLIFAYKNLPIFASVTQEFFWGYNLLRPGKQGSECKHLEDDYREGKEKRE